MFSIALCVQGVKRHEQLFFWSLAIYKCNYYYYYFYSHLYMKPIKNVHLVCIFKSGHTPLDYQNEPTKFVVIHSTGQC